MKKKNMPLIIAGILLLIILIVMLFPEWFTNKSPYSLNKLVISNDNGESSIEAAPFAPSNQFLLGTDDMGRDIFSYIVYGTRLTILLGVLIALGRFVIAIPLAVSAGFGRKIPRALIKIFNIVFSAIPAVLISLIILKMGFFVRLDKTNSALSFILVLSIVGWPKVSRLIMERVEEINGQSFIKSEVAIGKKRLRIALENVLPHLAPEIIVLQLIEIARSLTMIMTLGIFNVFVGNLRYVEDPQWGALNLANVSFNPQWGRYAVYEVSFEPEWASMLATSRSMLGSAPWAVLFPALAFFISILAFNLFGEGLRYAMQKKDSKAVPVMRKLLTFKVGYLWQHSKRRTRLIMLAGLILIAAIVFVPYSIHAGEYKLEEPETEPAPYEQVIIGTQQAHETAEMIVGEMKKLGIQTLKNGSYFMDYETGPFMFLTDSSVAFYDSENIIPAQMNADYTILSGGTLSCSGTVYNAAKDDLFNIKDYSVFDNSFVIIDKEHYNDSAINYFINNIQEQSAAKGILLIARYDDEIDSFFLEESEIPCLLLSRQFSEKLLSSNKASITIETTSRKTDGTGTNIVGIYGPYDPEKENKAVLIGMNYNYKKQQGSSVLGFNMELMKKICETYDNKRSIIFVFVDGTLKEESNGLYDISKTLPYSTYKVEVFIDLTRLNEFSFDRIEFSNALASYAKPFAWSIGTQLEKSFSSKGYELDELEAIERDSEHYLTKDESLNLMFWGRGISTVVAGSREKAGGSIDVYDVGSVILQIISENGY